VHAKGKATIDQSVNLLTSYAATINSTCHINAAAEGGAFLDDRTDYKGKKTVMNIEPASREQNGGHINFTDQSG
jgi:hypothetical protein